MNISKTYLLKHGIPLRIYFNNDSNDYTYFTINNFIYDSNIKTLISKNTDILGIDVRHFTGDRIETYKMRVEDTHTFILIHNIDSNNYRIFMFVGITEYKNKSHNKYRMISKLDDESEYIVLIER